MRFYKSDRIRTSLAPSKDVAATSAKRKREEQGMPPPAPRITFKQSKMGSGTSPSTPQPGGPLPKLHIPNHIAMPPPAPITPTSAVTPSTPGGGLKLKLKFGQTPK
jgi:transcription initiation factor TFIID subunit 2